MFPFFKYINMSRVRKLAEGDKLVAPKKETKLFETARGNINFDDFYNYQLSALDDEINLSGLTGANADAYRNEAIKYLDSMKSGNISKMNSDRSFVMNDYTNFNDYKNYQPKIDRSNWWERNIEGKGDSYIIDEDYAKNKAVENLTKKLNSWGIYDPQKEKPKKKSNFLYNYDSANPDLVKEVFKGGGWNADTWGNQYDDKTRMGYIGNIVQNKINSIDSDTENEWDFKSKMGFDNKDSWKSAANKVVELSRSGKLDNNFYAALQGAGLGEFRQLLDKNYSPDGTPRPTTPDSNVNQNPGEIQKVTENGQDVYKIWNPETNSLVNYDGISENPFDSDFGKIYYNGKLYNSYNDITDPNANLESIIENYNEVQGREKNAKYFDFNRGFGKGNDYMLRNDVNQLNNIQWSDNKKRNQVLDRSQAFSGLSAGNRFYSFKGNGVDSKHMIFDKDLNRNIEVGKVTKRQGVYFAEGKNGKQYLLGKYDPKVDGTNEGLTGGNNARIIRNTPLSKLDYNQDDPNVLNSALNRKFYDYLNYTSSDSDINNTFEWMSMSDNYQKGNMRVDKNSLSNPESAQYKIWKPIIDKYRITPDTAGIYTIPLDYLIESMGKKKSGSKSLNTNDWKVLGLRLFSTDPKDVPMVGNNKYVPYTGRKRGEHTYLKEGGTLKYQKGGYVFDGGYSPEESSPSTVTTGQYGSMNNWENMTGDEKTILMATLADIGSMAASFVPGANLGAAAVGAGASVARRVAGGSTNLEFAGDLALDALSLIPGAKLAKASKSFGKLGKIMAKALPAGMFIMSAGQVLGNTDEYSKLINKVNKDGITSLNVDDWKRVATLTGALVSGRATFKTSIPEAAKALNNKTFNKIVFRNNTVSNSVGVDIAGKNFSVPVSNAIAKNAKGVNKKSAESFTKEVNDYLNSEITKYTKDVDGKLMINKNAPEWAKNAASAGKNEQGGWNFTISDNAKVGRMPFRKAEVPKITSTADGSNVRRIFSLRPKDQRTAKQLDYTIDKMADPSGKNSLFRQWYPKQGENGTVISNNTSTASSVADSGVKPDVSSITRPMLGLPEGKPIPGPIITPPPANSQVPIPDRIHKMFNGTDVGTIKEVKIGNKTYFAERGSTGEARLLSQGDPKIDAYTTRLAEQRLQSLERGRQTRENNKLKVQQDKDQLAGQIDDRILSRLNAQERLDGIVQNSKNRLAGEIDDRAIARLNAKERLETMKETKELNETIKKQTKQLADKPKTDKSNKNKKPKKTSRDDKGIQRRKEGGIIKLQGGRKIYSNIYNNTPLLDLNNQPFNLQEAVVTPTSLVKPITQSQYLLPVQKSNAYSNILSGKTVVNPNIAPTGTSNGVGNNVVKSGDNGELRPGNSIFKNINSSSLLNSANLATGLMMANQAYNAARKFQPTMLNSPNINARSPQGNEVLNQFYRSSGLGVLNRLNKTMSSDQNYNTAALLEGTKYANEMAEKGALANDQEIKRTTELADRIEQQNIANRVNTANQNNASMVNSINMKNDLKSRNIGNIYNTLINPYMMEMRQRANQKEVMADQIALEELNKMPYRSYETEVNNLNTRMADAYNAWKGSDPNRTEELFKNSSEYKDLLKTMTGLRTKATQTYQDAILTNRKKMLGNSFFAKGGKVNNYVSYLKEFNKNLEKSEERYRIDVQKALDRASKNSIENTKLAKNLIFKIK